MCLNVEQETDKKVVSGFSFKKNIEDSPGEKFDIPKEENQTFENEKAKTESVTASDFNISTAEKEAQTTGPAFPDMNNTFTGQIASPAPPTAELNFDDFVA